MPDDFTVEIRLCNDEGRVEGEYLDLHNRLARREPLTEGFACTGSAHLAGEHIRCTSSAHGPAGRLDEELMARGTLPAGGNGAHAEPIQLEDVKRLRLEDGDAVMLRVADNIPREQLERIREEWTSQFPNHRAIVLAGPMEVTVLTEAQRAELIADLEAASAG